MAAEAELERMVVRIIGDSKSYQAMLEKAQVDAGKAAKVIESAGNRMERVKQQLDAVAKSFQSAGEALSSMGRSLSLKVTAPLTAMATYAVKAFGDFDLAMTESTAIMQVTTSQIDRMRQTALSLSGEVAKSPADLARSYYYLASAGLNAEQSMKALPVLAKFATAGAFSMETATSLLTNAQSALGLKVADTTQNMLNMARVSDVLIRANVLADGTTQQFSEALTNDAAAALKMYGKSVEEGVAALAAMADQGNKGLAAGSDLARVMRLMSNAALSNAGEQKALGFSVYDSAGKMRNLADIVENLENVLAGASDQQKAMKLEMMGFEARIQGAILPLLGTSKAIRQYQRELEAAGGYTEQVASRQMQAFWNQIQLVWNSVNTAAQQLGESLVPALKQAGEVIESVATWWRSLNRSTQTAIAYFGGTLAIIGPVVYALGQMAWATSYLVKAIRSLAVLEIVWTWLKRVHAYVASMPFTRMGTDATIASAQLKTMGTSGTTAAADIISGTNTATTGFRTMQTVLAEISAQLTAIATKMGIIKASAIPGNVAMPFTSVPFAPKNATLPFSGVKAPSATPYTTTSAPGGGMGIMPFTSGAGVASVSPAAAAAEATATAGKMGLMARAAGVASNAMGGLKAAMASAGSFLANFKLELGLLAGYLGYKLAQPLGEAIWGINEYNEAIAKAAELTDKVNAGIERKRQVGMAVIGAAATPEERRKAIAEELTKAEKEAQGYRAAVKGAQEQVDNLNTAWRRWTGNYPLELANKDLEEMQNRSRGAEQHVEQLKTMLATEVATAAATKKPLSPEAQQAQIAKDIQSVTDTINKQIGTAGMSEHAIQLAGLRARGATEDQLQYAYALLKQADAAEKAADAQKTVDDMIKELQNDVATFGMSSEDAKLYSAAQAGASRDTIKQAEALLKNKEALEKQKKAMDDGKELTKKYAPEAQRLMDRQKELADLYNRGAITIDVYKKALEEAEQQTHKDYTANFKVSGIDAIRSGSAEMYAMLEAQQEMAKGIPGMGKYAELVNPKKPKGPTPSLNVAPLWFDEYNAASSGLASAGNWLKGTAGPALAQAFWPNSRFAPSVGSRGDQYGGFVTAGATLPKSATNDVTAASRVFEGVDLGVSVATAAAKLRATQEEMISRGWSVPVEDVDRLKRMEAASNRMTPEENRAAGITGRLMGPDGDGAPIKEKLTELVELAKKYWNGESIQLAQSGLN